MSDIFISHVEEDSDIALEIASAVEASGYSTWYYERDSLPGPSYLLQTSREIENSQAVVLIISPDSLSSHQVTKEVVRAHESGKPFVPVLKSISHVEFTARQPEWKEAVGSATSVTVPREGPAVIIPRILQGLRGMGIEPTGTTGPPTTYVPPRPKKRPLFAIGRVRFFPSTMIISLLLLGAIVGGGIIFASANNEDPPAPSATGTDLPFFPGAVEPEPQTSPAQVLDAATADLNTSLGALRVTAARLTTEACPPPQIPEPCSRTTGSNRFLILELKGSGGGDIGLTTAFTTEAHSSIINWGKKRYGASRVSYDDVTGDVQIVYGVLPADSAAGPLLLEWQENPLLQLTVSK